MIRMRGFKNAFRMSRILCVNFLPAASAILLLTSCGDGSINSNLDSDLENFCYEDYVRSYPDLLSAYNSSKSGKTIENWGKVHYDGIGSAEGRIVPINNCGSQKDLKSDADYAYLFKHNAHRLDGLTARWPTVNITVSGANSASWRKAIRRWPAVNFQFVESNGNISIRYIDSNDRCGNAITYRTSSGTILACDIEINRKIEIGRNRTCRDHRDVVAHEIGHCIGFFGHTSDGSIMDARVGENQALTRPVRNMINLLYSLPPGTDIKPYL